MTNPTSCVTIHMAASLDGYIARKDGRVDWMDTSDEYAQGVAMDSGSIDAFFRSVGCYVMGSRTYETALRFEAQGFGWAYGDKPTFVLTSRTLPRPHDNVEFYAGDLTEFVNGRLRTQFRSVWIVGGGAIAADCLRRGLADEVSFALLPIVIGDGISFFEGLDTDVALHLLGATTFNTGMVELRYAVRPRPAEAGATR